MNTPMYQHDCEDCMFLEHVDVYRVDVYWCKQAKPFPTMVIRYSNEPSHYTSFPEPIIQQMIQVESQADGIVVATVMYRKHFL